MVFLQNKQKKSIIFRKGTKVCSARATLTICKNKLNMLKCCFFTVIHFLDAGVTSLELVPNNLNADYTIPFT